ncbi:MAG: hypothetical protein SV775_15365 [Thermodesulfobacteriota bacterium]|nr:hypothetical protein [Thermodesulfobacteriota bacterium]
MTKRIGSILVIISILLLWSTANGQEVLTPASAQQVLEARNSSANMAYPVKSDAILTQYYRILSWISKNTRLNPAEWTTDGDVVMVSDCVQTTSESCSMLYTHDPRRLLTVFTQDIPDEIVGNPMPPNRLQHYALQFFLTQGFITLTQRDRILASRTMRIAEKEEDSNTEEVLAQLVWIGRQFDGRCVFESGLFLGFRPDFEIPLSLRIMRWASLNESAPRDIVKKGTDKLLSEVQQRLQALVIDQLSEVQIHGAEPVWYQTETELVPVVLVNGQISPGPGQESDSWSPEPFVELFAVESGAHLDTIIRNPENPSSEPSTDPGGVDDPGE